MTERVASVPPQASTAQANTHLLLIAHAPLAGAFRDIALHAFPEAAADITAIDVTAIESIGEAIEQVATALIGIQSPLLVLVDVFGATPANALLSAVQPDVAVVSGLNVAMLWRALGYRHEPPAKLAELASQGGLRSIQVRPSIQEFETF